MNTPTTKPQPEKYTHEERVSLLYRLFDQVLDSLIEHFERVREGKLKLRAQFLLAALAFLKLNGIKAERAARRGIYGELRNLREAIRRHDEEEKAPEEFSEPFH